MIRKTTISLLAIALLALSALPASAGAFRVETFAGSLTNPDGTTQLQAGAHPDFFVKVDFGTRIDPSTGWAVPDDNPKDVNVSLPAGFVGNPTVVPTCTQRQLQGSGFVPQCPQASQIGLATFSNINRGRVGHTTRPLYNLDPPPGVAGQFGFNAGRILVFVNASVSADGEYHLRTDTSEISQGLALVGSELTFWGVPASSDHDLERSTNGISMPTAPNPSSAKPAKPMMINPTVCTGAPMRTVAQADSWQNPGAFVETAFEADLAGNPLIVTGCDQVPFEATLQAQPTTREAEAPSGLEVAIDVPQNDLAEGLSSSTLRRAVVSLPEGMTINPAAATGLGSCAPEQIGLGGNAAATCPDSSKIGTVEIESPLLDQPLTGGVYQAAQGRNPFGSLLALYIAVDDPETGTVLKLAGKVEPDASTGRLVVSFDEQPKLPFEHLRMRLFGGSHAPLMTPSACGEYTTTALFSPWSGTAPVPAEDRFQVTAGPHGAPCPTGGFAPSFEAGTVKPVAGENSPFVLRVGRADGSARLGGLEAILPTGLLASLRGIPYCPDASLAGISGAAGAGIGQLAAPSCPAASRVGSLVVSAGAGPSPFDLNTGVAYLAGPYKGAPLSLAFVTPAVAGPFDLGNVVVRAALNVDPVTTQVRAVSDPLPTILHGIPLDLRELRVSLDRDGFTLNPTSCASKAIAGRVSSTGNAVAALDTPFRVSGCRGLGFTPRLSLSLKGGTGRGAHPALTAVLRARPGQANIGRVAVGLPHSEFLAQEHIRTICTRVQWAADACPKGSIYGYAEAVTPLLDQPLRGPVYLRSSDHRLPDLVADLEGQINIELDGRIDSHNRGIRTTFAGVPDAPVTKFVLRMQGGRKGLLVNSTDTCRGVRRATVRMDGQNGRPHDFLQRLGSSCKKRKSHGGR
jgi:hypothetical protein